MRVLIVDDSPVMRAGLHAMLETIDDVEDIVVAENGRQALDILAKPAAPVDIVFLDVRMPGIDGLAVLERIRDVPVVMLTNADDAETIHAAMMRGAKGYLVNGEFTEEEFVATLRLCSHGGIVWGTTAAALMNDDSSSPDEPPDAFDLTERERELVKALAQGLSNQQIAEQLFLSEKTVRNILHHIYVKIGVSSRTEAIVAWLQQEKHDG